MVEQLHGIIVPAMSLLQQISGPPAPALADDSVIVSMDVHQFSPEEVTVKIKGDELVIEGKHEEKHDGHGFIARNVMRRVFVPAGVDSNTINCDVSCDGVLKISGHKKGVVEGEGRSLRVHYTGRPAAGSDPIVNPSEDVPPGEKKHFHEEFVTGAGG